MNETEMQQAQLVVNKTAEIMDKHFLPFCVITLIVLFIGFSFWLLRSMIRGEKITTTKLQ